ncbi:MAG: hypothetical protein LZF60_20226 [Nitrospira sp.]|nr:MAG: hypothetical protein LZF60_20226 [Nitrospira sp.]
MWFPCSEKVNHHPDPHLLSGKASFVGRSELKNGRVEQDLVLGSWVSLAFSGPGWANISGVIFSIIDSNLCCVLGTDTGFDFMTIDNLTFNVTEPANVPEGPSFLFLALDLVGLACAATYKGKIQRNDHNSVA